MSAIVEPHAPRVNHTRHTEPPTKGWQLAWEAAQQGHAWCQVGWLPEEHTSCATEDGTPCGRGNRAVLDRCQLALSQRLSQRSGTRWDQQVSPPLLQGESERESIVLHWQSRSQLEQREEVELRETKRTPACQKRRDKEAGGEKKNTYLGWTKVNKTNEKKKVLKQPFSEH